MIKKSTHSFSHKRIKAALCAVLCSALTAMPAFATGEDNSSAATGTTVWTKASEIMQDVYSQIISISTVTAVVCAAVALLLMNFSKNGKTVDDSRAWLKRIAITWAILNVGYITARATSCLKAERGNKSLKLRVIAAVKHGIIAAPAVKFYDVVYLWP